MLWSLKRWRLRETKFSSWLESWIITLMMLCDFLFDFFWYITTHQRQLHILICSNWIPFKYTTMHPVHTGKKMRLKTLQERLKKWINVIYKTLLPWFIHFHKRNMTFFYQTQFFSQTSDIESNVKNLTNKWSAKNATFNYKT